MPRTTASPTDSPTDSCPATAPWTPPWPEASPVSAVPAAAPRRRRGLLLPGLLGAALLVAAVPPALGSVATAEPPPPAVLSATNAVTRAVSPEPQRVVLVQVETPAGPVQRDYLYAVPEVGDGAPRPVVVALHGRAQSVEALRAVSGLEQLGAREGFVTVFPSGWDGAWNAGTCCVREAEPAMPDVEFLDQVLADLADRTPVDPTRVHLVGYSNGGMMAYRYACQRSAAVAGIGVVSGSMAASPDYADSGPHRCRPATPVSVVAVHGGEDRTVPYEGGAVAGSAGATVAPVRAGLDQAAVAAQCRTGTTSRVGASSRLDYTRCAGGAAVRLVKLHGHGHGWTRDSRRYGYDTTVGIWSFLTPRRAASAG